VNSYLLLNPPGRINFYTNPLQVRKWLSLLVNDPLAGFRIKPDLFLKRHRLGFSFQSNALGLRGPCAQEAANLIIGTSYAMSFTVDNGRNWYEKGFDARSWMNIGLPVGIPQIEELYKRYYRGSSSLALVLYHPNYWVTTRNYEKWRQNGNSVFEAFNWETNLRRCLRMYAKKLKRQNRDLASGKVIMFSHSGVTYHVNSEYNYFEFKKYPDIVSLTIRSLERMIKKFRRVIVVRTQIKQEFVPGELRNKILQQTVDSYQVGWRLIREGLKGLKRVEYHEVDGFELGDFQPWDTHWNENGNLKFSHFIQKIL